MNAAHKQYFRALLLCLVASLLPILLLNLILINQTQNSYDNTQLASAWQQQTQGIVNAPSMLDNHHFKFLRLKDKLPEINTVIFGASTMFAINQQMFPAEMKIYNFSKNGAGLSQMIGEAEYLMNHQNNVKWLIIPLDWSLGFIYQNDLPPVMDLSAPYSRTNSPQVTLLEKIRDSLSYPRVEGLFKLFKAIFASEHKVDAFRQIFLQPASDEYFCTGNIPAKDFDIQSRGKCRGFWADGSWSYNSMDRVEDANRLILLATASNSKYTQNLLKTRGVPNADYLRRLAVLAHQAEKRGGGAVFVLPPLLTGMENKLLQHQEYSIYLNKTHQSLSDWAKKENLVLLNAGASEKFACTSNEFTDEHHATQSCYQKIFSNFWQNSHKPDGTPLLPPGNLTDLLDPP